MARNSSALLVLVVTLMHYVPVAADTFVVDVAGGGDFMTISQGMDEASSGDTVLVYAGTYTGSENAWLDFGGRDIVLRSTAGRDKTIIDLGLGGWKPAFTFESGESRQAVVDGFTVSEGRRWNIGGGFVCIDASPTIRNCLFTRCSAEGEHHVDGLGGAGYLQNSQALIENCSFVRNYANNSGDGLWIGGGSDVAILNCDFAQNDGSFELDGAVVVYSGSALIEGCTFFSNRDGAATIHSAAQFNGCTFVANGNGIYDSVIYAHRNCVLRRCLFAFNDVEYTVESYGSSPYILHCCFHQSGTHASGVTVDPETNLFEDPLLCGLDSDDYTLCANSPCLPAGNPWGVTIGASGEGCPDCDSPVEATSWGAIKALYR